MRDLLYNIAELADGMENSRHDAALAHLEAISRMVKQARSSLSPVGASGEPEDRFAPCNSTDPMEHFWTAVKRGWDIEPRAYFEREAVPMGFRSPVEMAVHHMWKRHAKDWPAAASVPSPPAQESKMTTSTGIALTVERYNDLLEGERGMWATLKAHSKLVAALMKIRDNAAADSVAIARDALSTDLREIDWSALDALKALPSPPVADSPTCQHCHEPQQTPYCWWCGLPHSSAPSASAAGEEEEKQK